MEFRPYAYRDPETLHDLYDLEERVASLRDFFGLPPFVPSPRLGPPSPAIQRMLNFAGKSPDRARRENFTVGNLIEIANWAANLQLENDRLRSHREADQNNVQD